TAAELTGNAGRLYNCPDAVAVYGTALLCAIEIDQVQISSAGRDPAPRHLGRIGPEDSLLRVIALPEPNALAAAQIDGRINQHGRRPLGPPGITRPTGWHALRYSEGRAFGCLTPFGVPQSVPPNL